MIRVKVRLFGSFRRFANGSDVSLELAGPLKINELRRELAAKLKAIDAGFHEEALLDASAFANETTVLTNDAEVTADCTIAILPPVCGG